MSQRAGELSGVQDQNGSCRTVRCFGGIRDTKVFNQPSRSVGDLRQSSTHDGRCNALAFRRNATHPVPHSRSFKGLLIALDVGDVLADCRGNAFKVIFRVGGQRSVL